LIASPPQLFDALVAPESGDFELEGVVVGFGLLKEAQVVPVVGH